MDTATLVAIGTSVTAVIGSALVWMNSRQANKNTSESDVRKWADELLQTLRETQKEADRIRVEMHQLADEIQTIRRQAWQEDSMPRFREWLANRPAARNENR